MNSTRTVAEDLALVLRIWTENDVREIERESFRAFARKEETLKPDPDTGSNQQPGILSFNASEEATAKTLHKASDRLNDRIIDSD